MPILTIHFKQCKLLFINYLPYNIKYSKILHVVKTFHTFNSFDSIDFKVSHIR